MSVRTRGSELISEPDAGKRQLPRIECIVDHNATAAFDSDRRQEAPFLPPRKSLV
jgi:hypothetical protein